MSHLDVFNHNPYIAPSIAGLRRFILQCEPKVDFPHIVFACGTVVRYDLASKIPVVTPLSFKDDAYDWAAQYYSDERWPNAVQYAYNVLKSSPPPDVGAAQVNLSPCDVSPDAGMMTHMAHFKNAAHPGAIFVIAPGNDELEASEYGMAAYRNDFVVPRVYCMIVPAGDGYELKWAGTPPNTMHMPKKFE